MNTYQKFDLANGYCYILPQYIVITDHSDPTEILRRKERNTMGVFLVILFILSVIILAASAFLIPAGRQDDAYILFTAGVFGIAICMKWRNRSNVKVIDRSQIRNIQLKKSFFNPVFIILFKNSKGKFKERALVMKSNNLQKIDLALRIFRSHNLMSEQSINQQKIVTPKMAEQNLKTIMKTKPETKKESKTEPEKTSAKDYKRDPDGYVKEY